MKAQGQSVSVTTPLLSILGWLALAFGVFGAIKIGGANVVGTVVMLLLFGGLGAALVLMSARIRVDNEGLEVHQLTGRHRIAWRDVTRVEKGGGNLVLFADRRRLTCPASEFWWGNDRQQLLQRLGEQLASRGIKVSDSVRAMFSYTRGQ
jgi:hypothetical protein